MHSESTIFTMSFDDGDIPAPGAVASLGLALLSMIERVLAESASYVETECKGLGKDFLLLANYVNAGEIPSRHISDAIDRVIGGMQFQDRNTQVMRDAGHILRRYRLMLEAVCDAASAPHSATMTEEICSGIRLSEMRRQLLEALGERHMNAELPDAGYSAELF